MFPNLLRLSVKSYKILAGFHFGCWLRPARSSLLLLLSVPFQAPGLCRGNAPSSCTHGPSGHVDTDLPGCFSTMRLSAKTPVSLQPPDLRLLFGQIPTGVVIAEDVACPLSLRLSGLSQPNLAPLGLSFSEPVFPEAHTSGTCWTSSLFREPGSPNTPSLYRASSNGLNIANLQLSYISVL